MPYYIYNDGDIENSKWFYAVWNGAEWYTPQDADGYDTREEAEESARCYIASV